ncbi:MAG: hypothetical protein K6U03_10915, partial [Firmicutes bacterium]|nr:hypothetical protein [Bacillota bacterium]
MPRSVKWPLRHLFRPPRQRRFLYWVGLASGLLLPLITWADRSMPLHWRGTVFVNTALSLGRASLYLVFFVAFLFGLLAFLPALGRALFRKSPSEALALGLPLVLQILALVTLPLIPVRTGFTANRRAYQEAIALVARKT